MPPVPRLIALAVFLAILPSLLGDAFAQESRTPRDLPFAGAGWKWTAPRELTSPEPVPAYGVNFDVASTGIDALVVWSFRNRVFAARLGPDGSPSAPILLGQRPQYSHDYPSVAWNGERYLVIWTSDHAYVEGQFLARDGFPLGEPMRFAEPASLPFLIASNGDSFLVAFETPSGYRPISVNLVAPSGSIESIPTEISSATAIASDGDDYLVLTRTTAYRLSENGGAMTVTPLAETVEAIVWMENDYLAVTAGGLLRLDRDGRPLGSPIPLDRLQYGKADLLSLDGDSALIVDRGFDDSIGRLRLSRLDGDVVTKGVAIPAEPQARALLGRAGAVRLFRDWGPITQEEVDPASLSIVSSEGSPVALAAPDQLKFRAVPTTAGYFAAWGEQRSGAWSLRAAVIEPDGDVAGEALVAAPEEPGYGYRLTPALATSGNVVLVAWYERGVRGRRFTSSGQPLDAEPIEIASRAVSGYGEHAAPAVTWNGATFVVAWPESAAMRVARVTADGVLLDGEGVAIPATLPGAYPPSFPALASTGGVTLLVWQEGVFPYTCQILCEFPPPPQLVAMRLDRNLGRLDPEPFFLAPPGKHAFPTAAASGDGFLVAAVHVTNGSAAIRVGANGTIRDVPPLEEILRFPLTSLLDAETSALRGAEGIAVASAPSGFLLAASTTGSRHQSEEPLPSDDLRLTFVPSDGAPSQPVVLTPGALHFPRPEIAILPDGTTLVLYAGRRDDLGLATRASFQILRPLAAPRRRLAGR